MSPRGTGWASVAHAIVLALATHTITLAAHTIVLALIVLTYVNET
jgi:hypothetical protein